MHMFTGRRLKRFFVVALGLISGAVVGSACFPAAAQQEKLLDHGRAEFELNCVPCHGEEGRGDGPVAKVLLVKPTDLTTIAEENAGTFPFWMIYESIDGTNPVVAHDVIWMPPWGKRFEQEEKRQYAPAYLRLLMLTHYVESIQEY
ncbi:MAG: cytochrome C [Rhodospirillaceae bacterium]|jgi:mono/diheme cytochrome c family protein|nr:cytochrome C [Rhodospirillaceae bacterium]MBT5658689.1 cytochrome C [Rhodospirillaceae bacterium]MBT5753005.1 cytochrome C [Rhodospirillaceae bacterium]